jgi:iron complex outermembrane receptor protein
MLFARKTGVLMLAAVASGATFNSAFAQQEAGAAETRGITEIVVTARKREEKINEVPLAISAFSADDIASRNIESLSDVAKYTAGFSFENFAGGTSPAPIIRGLTQNTLTDRNQNVGTFVDGVHIQQQGNIDFALLDVERIEVLKGPQNAQYGRSAFAGAINYVSKKPVLGEIDGDAAVTVGSDERLETRGSVSVPLWSDKLAVRVYGVTSESDGTWGNNFSGGDNGIATRDTSFGNSFDGTDGNLGGWNNDAYQTQLRFHPLETLRFDLGYFKSDVENEQGAIEFIRPNGSTIWGLDHQTNCNPNSAGTMRFVCGKLDVNSSSVTVDPRSVGLYAETSLLTGRVEWDIVEEITASYLYGHNDLDQNTFAHSSNPPNPELEGCGAFASTAPPCATPTTPTGILMLTGPTNQKATSHELRFDGRLLEDALTWRLGYYHSNVEDKSFVNSVETRRSLIQDPTGQISIAAFPTAATRFKDKTDAWFGALGYNFAEIYTVDVEARYAAEERAQLTGTLPPRTFYDFTPRVSLKAQILPETMVYGSVAEGSKSGGFNTLTADPGFETYEAETNTTYELGAKQTLLDGRLQLNYDVFYIDWKDLQLPTADLIPANPASPSTDANYITNASGASSWGVELEAVALIDEHWTVNFAGSYAEPEFDSGTLDFGLGAQCANSSAPPVCPVVTVVRPPRPDAFASPIGGNQLARTPTTKLAGGLEYRSEYAGWEYAMRGDLSYQDKQYAEVLNLAYLPSRTLLDLNVTVIMPNRNWSVSLWGKNVTDEEYVSNSYVIGFSNTYGAALAPGATWGLTARYDFAGK